MTHPSKNKGNNYERELVKLAQAHGLPAKRAYASNGEALGHSVEVDLLIGQERVQAKRRRTLAAFLKPSEDVDAVVFREDRGESFVLLRFDDWLELVKETEQARLRWKG